jgi:bifunctional non-homologous end joining protein LigD
MRITHPERVLWPATDEHPAITKRQLLEYFARVEPYLMPHLRDRPLTLRRYPTGLDGKHFYQKHVEFPLPDFVERVRLYAEQHQSSGDYVVCNNFETLVWLGQISNIELHCWNSRTDPLPDAAERPKSFSDSVEALESSVLNYPDFMVFDLDPYLYSGRERSGGEPLLHEPGFDAVRHSARWLKEVLDDLRLTSFIKTSGKSGVHVFVPILRQLDYDAVRAVSEQICRFVLRQHPEDLTMEWSVPKRRGKVFLDYNQNTRGKTLAAAYSPRAVQGAPVSIPFDWHELDEVYPAHFTIETVPERLDRIGDLWQSVLDRKNDLAALLGVSE